MGEVGSPPAAPAAPARAPMQVPWRALTVAMSAGVLCVAALGSAASLGAFDVGVGGAEHDGRARRLRWGRFNSYDDLMATATEGGTQIIPPGEGGTQIIPPGVSVSGYTGIQHPLNAVNPIQVNVAPPMGAASTGFQLCRNALLPGGGCCQQILSACCEAKPHNAPSDSTKRFQMCFNPATSMIRLRSDSEGRSFGLLMSEALGTEDVAWHGRWEDGAARAAPGAGQRLGRVEDFTAYRFQNDQTRNNSPFIQNTPFR